MLLAEINGKICPDTEGLEDLITSAVFGHLRMVDPPRFWAELFGRAKTVEAQSQSLYDSLFTLGCDPNKYSAVSVRFWRDCSSYGEPDLLLYFTGEAVRPLTLVIEVKLNSGKSGTGEHDQLARYLSLLDDPAFMKDWPCDPQMRFLIYLTRRFSTYDLNQSIATCEAEQPGKRMFGLEWNDLLEVARNQSVLDDLLDEVARFLKRRGFERFSGFHQHAFEMFPSGGFYQTRYFEDASQFDYREDLRGKFYGG